MGGATYWCSFVKKGNGFKEDHWHDHNDIEEIIKARLNTQKMVKIAGNGGSDDGRIYCGQENAYVEVMIDNAWKRELNKKIVDEKEGKTLPSANVSSSAGGSGGADNSRSPSVNKLF